MSVTSSVGVRLYDGRRQLLDGTADGFMRISTATRLTMSRDSSSSGFCVHRRAFFRQLQ